MEQPQRTPFQLYAHAIAAYQQATFTKLMARNWRCSTKEKWRRPLGIFIYILILFVGLLMISLLFLTLEPSVFLLTQSSFLIILVIFTWWWRHNFEINLRSSFDIDNNEYICLSQSFRTDWEFYRYLLFRGELNHRQWSTQDVEKVKGLLDLEQQTLGSYVAQKPLTVWLLTTSGASIAASATNWLLKEAFIVASIGGVFALILYVVPMFITNQRRQYELRRWLAWYKADLAETKGITS